MLQLIRVFFNKHIAQILSVLVHAHLLDHVFRIERPDFSWQMPYARALWSESIRDLPQ